MADVLQWNQIDHGKSTPRESRIYICESATPYLFYALFFGRLIIYASTYRDSILSMFFLPLVVSHLCLPVGIQVVNTHWCLPMQDSLVVRNDKPFQNV